MGTGSTAATPDDELARTYTLTYTDGTSSVTTTKTYWATAILSDHGMVSYYLEEAFSLPSIAELYDESEFP